MFANEGTIEEKKGEGGGEVLVLVVVVLEFLLLPPPSSTSPATRRRMEDLGWGLGGGGGIRRRRKSGRWWSWLCGEPTAPLDCCRLLSRDGWRGSFSAARNVGLLYVHSRYLLFLSFLFIVLGSSRWASKVSTPGPP